MEDKYILILGAGLMQKPAIEAARELGLKTLVVDANPAAVCVPFTDRFEPIDLKDTEKLTKLAQSFGKNLVGVFTAGTDFSTSVSYIAEKCGLPAHSYQAALNASNKILMRECFKKAGVGSPNFLQLDRSQIASFLQPKTFNTLKFPLVVKPVDNMGARGCRLIRNADEFLPSVEDAVRNSRSGRAILEDYMEGPEFSIDAIVYNNTFTITGFADRHIYYPPYFIEMGHTMPTVIDKQKRMELIATFAKGAKALGLSCGVAKADIKYTANGPMIGEIAGRLSGGYMSGWTYPYSSTVHLTKEAMLVACGLPPEELLQKRYPLPIKDVPFPIYEIPSLRTAAERAWISIPGRIKEIIGGDYMQHSPFVKDVLFRSRSGDKVVFPRNNVEKCGNCIAVSNHYDLAVDAAEYAISQLLLRLESHNPETEAFLAGKRKKDEDAFPPYAFTLRASEIQLLKRHARSFPIIPENKKVSEFLPKELERTANRVKDWNHRTMKQSLFLFDLYIPHHPAIKMQDFWDALIIGGLQGIVYVSDCAKNSENKNKGLLKK